MIAKLRRIAIYDTTNDKVVVLTTIQEGVEGSGGFFYEEEEDTLAIDDDQSLLLSFLCKLEARVLGNSSVRADLEAMVGEECIISGVGIDGFVQFGRVVPTTGNTNTFADTVKIVAIDQVDKSTVFRIVAQRRSVKGYSSGIARGSVGAFNSLLNVYEVISGTTGAGGVPYGFALEDGTSTGTNTTSGYAFFSNTLVASGFGYKSSRFLFPFTGIPVTFSLRTESTGTEGIAVIATYTGTTTVTEEARVTFNGFDGDPVGTRVSVGITPTASTRWVGALIGTTAAGTVGFSLPALRVNGLTAYEGF
jgi:hypothetical protein